MKVARALALTPTAIMNEGVGMAGLVQAQSIRQPGRRPCAIRPPIEARRVERQAVSSREHQGIVGALISLRASAMQRLAQSALSSASLVSLTKSCKFMASLGEGSKPKCS